MNDYEILKKKINIVDEISERIQLKRSSKVYKACCPFHSDKTPSFTVYPESNSFHCFGCGESGTVIDFVMKIEGYHSPVDALTKLADKHNITLPGTDLESVKRKKSLVQEERKKIAAFYKKKQEVEAYVFGRGITREVSKQFGLGYNQKNHSLTIPILSTYSETVGMAERFLNDVQPKYKNSIESEVYKKSELLFGLDKARKHIKEKVYIVEGYFDVMSMHVLGLPETVAYCGQNITDGQSKLLSNYITTRTKIYLIPDNDLTGKNSIKKNIKALRLFNKNRISIIDLPEGCKDMNDFLQTGQAFETLKPETSEFYLLRKDLDDCLELEDEYHVAYEYAKATKNEMLRSDMAKYLSDRWKKPLEVVNNHMNSPDNVVDYTTKMYTATESYLSAQKELQSTHNYLKTGLADIDKHMQKVKRKEVMFVLGKSGSGKTTFILNLIYNMVMNQGLNVLFNSLELAKESVIPQMIQIHKDVTAGQADRIIKSGESDKETMELIQKLDDHFRIIDEDGQTMKDLENYVNTANQSVFDEPVSVVFVDYFQYIKAEGRRSAYEEKSDMAKEMKALSKRLNVFMVVLTQANREGGGNGDKPLSLSSARDTGAIEESGDYVLGLYRPGANPELTDGQRQEVQNEMYCQILKNRWGIQTQVPLFFIGMTKRIEDARGRF